MPSSVFFLILLIGTLHHWIGYKLILNKKALERVKPKRLLGRFCTKKVLLTMWHFSTACWFGFGGVIFVFTVFENPSKETVLFVALCVFSISGWLCTYSRNHKLIYWCIFLIMSSMSFIVAKH
ncbi:hypothetical protein N483_16045 [Pseudoalteromonas luteoviolacea NCIMB 1944]|uniref:Uncharacterized protein n=1 Tax=Pseudoalteromonas luteoviolacea (strain 2ta16) TaxID=1353533 RepID=V4HSF5_PSEL2|nr:hypothetical protein PL2TA16_02969 [Pseudoalteromonas luteoviolacea 2ta16]KZN41121.1 hypothetical protein N483_16045 [Pseudoalteromonas luteoviolacea NCIMB 1944]